MTKREFWQLVLFTSLISTGLVLFLLRWPAPPPADAQYAPPTAPAVDVPLTEDERINERVYEDARRGVVNIVSTTIDYGWIFEPVARRGVGSGFIIDDQGHIVTNYHVIEGAESLDVTLYDNSRHEAKVVGYDRTYDVAVIRIDCPENRCYPVPMGTSSNLKVGQKVLAIGNPFGLQSTLTTGIVSSLGRRIETETQTIDEVIQTDAAINPGNSGGPLLNAAGQVVGVNTAIYSRSGDSAGISFAVPIDAVRRVVPDLITHGRVNRPWMGLRRAVQLTPQLAEVLGLPVEYGLLIESLERDSSLDNAGLRGGDRVVIVWNRYRMVVGGDVLASVGGRELREEKDLDRALVDKRPGEKTTIVYYRDGKRFEKEIELIGVAGPRRRRL